MQLRSSTSLKRRDRLGTEPVQPSRLGGRDVLLLSIWFALTGALIELMGRAAEKFVLGRVIQMSRDAIWLAPLGQMLLLLPLVAALLIARILLRRDLSLPVVVGVLSFSMYLGLLVLPGWLAWYAALLLALGFALQSARLVHPRGASFQRWVRRTVLPLGLLLWVAAAAVTGTRMLRERAAVASLGAAQAGAPNVLLLIWDTVRARSLSLYGHDRPTTPNLDAFARSGVIFDHAYAASSWTLPSHGAMFTGQLPHEQTSSWIRPLDATHATLAEVFRDVGYVTAGFVANTRYADWEHGLARGFLHYEDYPVSAGEMLWSTSLGRSLLRGTGGWDRGLLARLIGYEDSPGRKSADRVNSDFLRWLDEQDGRPLFAFLNYFDAHLPYVPPASFAGTFGVPRPETTFVQRLRREVERDGYWDMPPAELAAELAAYEGAIAYLDDRFGRLMRELERRGVLENTIVVLASDHGEEFKEHGGQAHGTNLYSWQTHVPLVVYWKGHTPGGSRVQAPVSLRDLPATLTGLADVPGGDVFPGESLVSYWTDGSSAAPPRAVLAEVSPGLARERRIQSITVAPHQLIRNVDGTLELYDVVADPEQRHRLDADDERSAIARHLEELLDALTRCTDARCCCDSARAPAPEPLQRISR